MARGARIKRKLDQFIEGERPGRTMIINEIAQAIGWTGNNGHLARFVLLKVAEGKLLRAGKRYHMGQTLREYKIPEKTEDEGLGLIGEA